MSDSSSGQTTSAMVPCISPLGQDSSTGSSFSASRTFAAHSPKSEDQPISFKFIYRASARFLILKEMCLFVKIGSVHSRHLSEAIPRPSVPRRGSLNEKGPEARRLPVQSLRQALRRHSERPSTQLHRPNSVHPVNSTNERASSPSRCRTCRSTRCRRVPHRGRDPRSSACGSDLCPQTRHSANRESRPR